MASRLLLQNLSKRHLLRSTFASRSASTLVLAEHEGGSIKAQSLSAVVAANSLSQDNPVSLLLAGSGSSLHQAAEKAATCHPSISQVLVADSEKFAYPLAEPWAKLIQLVQLKGDYSHVIATSDSFGKNILPRAAALLDVSPVTDVVDINGPHQFIRPIYAGNALCTVQYTGANPCMLTVRSTSFPVPHISVDSKSGAASISEVDLSTLDEGPFTWILGLQLESIPCLEAIILTLIADSVGKSRFMKLSSQDTGRPDLGSAKIVVTGGRALKSAENFKMIEKLAEKLGAAVGATRAAVDAGFVPNELQVGQTGKIVAPELYMAFGVSGAIQHLAGMKDSKIIVAVNKDSDAPIFQVADYGLVGDLFEVIPELLEKLPEKK
ncbi:electron transfer flavoprotein subunit alpha, mitochondrial [Gossypium australe]|uniref:Electron transfer flavoprotein subunit alpha n=1 Tax=Gossypium australe TaxID=47621 RepID=A0A5B6VEG4_9ROSI|nr:electron transfer flavoprotein subunit alpha, mitochondrial [Gossypium australe]